MNSFRTAIPVMQMNTYTFEAASPDCAAAVALMAALSDTLAAITGDSGRASFDAQDVRGARACFVIARNGQGDAAACGALRPLADDVAEIKRMYAVPGNAGAGSAVLAHLEREAVRLGYQQVWLETRVVNTGAVAFYEKRGYTRMPNYGKYVGRTEAVCFRKQLGGGAPDLTQA